MRVAHAPGRDSASASGALPAGHDIADLAGAELYLREVSEARCPSGTFEMPSSLPAFWIDRRAMACLLAALLPIASGFAPALCREPDGAPAPAGPVNDPISAVLEQRHTSRSREAPPPDARARLQLEIVEVMSGHGSHTLGSFSAPLKSEHPVRLQRRFDLPARSGAPPVSIDIDLRLLPVRLITGSVRFELESRCRIHTREDGWFVRRSTEELRQSRSALLETFQVPGTSRRLLLALSWSSVPADPVEEFFPPPPSRMVDLVLELIREEKGSQQTLRRQFLSTALGTQAVSLLRLSRPFEEAGSSQHLEVRLHPQRLDDGQLWLGIQVQGALEGQDESEGLRWIDYRDVTRIGVGRRYSLGLGGGPESASYRLDIRPYYQPQ